MARSDILVPSGLWGGLEGKLSATPGRNVIDMPCGQFVFGPIAADRSQKLTATGRYESYNPGPQAGDGAPSTVTATLTGQLRGDILELRLSAEGQPAFQTLTLKRGLSTKVIRCL